MHAKLENKPNCHFATFLSPTLYILKYSFDVVIISAIAHNAVVPFRKHGSLSAAMLIHRV